MRAARLCSSGRPSSLRRPIPNPPPQAPRAFTLVELLVVITIIAILASIALGVVGGLIGQARDAATKATLSKIQGLLNSRSQAFDRLIKRKGYLTGSNEYRMVQQNYLFVNNPNTQATLATKLLYAKFFPQYAKEIDQTLYQKNTTGKQIWQADLSAEILYDILTQSNTLGDTPVAADMFTSAEVRDNDNDGLPEFIDGWGNPLRFYRWPTRLFRSAGQNPKTGALNPITSPTSNPATGPNPDGTYDVNNAQLLFGTLPVFTGNLQFDLSRDPMDPLQDCLNVFNNNGTPFENFVDPWTGVIFHTPATYYVLLVISAGPDGVLGLYEPDDTNPAHNGHLGGKKLQTDWPSPNNDPLTDDIVTLSIRAGGK